MIVSKRNIIFSYNANNDDRERIFTMARKCGVQCRATRRCGCGGFTLRG